MDEYIPSLSFNGNTLFRARDNKCWITDLFVFSNCPEVGIYKRKIFRKKERKYAFGQEKK